MASTRTLFAAALLTVAAGSSHAQFVGDVFARVPSQAVPAGGQATVELQLFSGANVFGASIVDLSFQPGQLAVREVRLTGSSGQRRIAVERTTSGRVEIATFNVDGRASPIGTVTLAEVVFDVIAPPGTTARYRIAPRQIITQGEARFASVRGSEGDVVVTSPQTLRTARAAGLTALADPAQPGTDAQLMQRAAAMRPGGGQVDLVVPVRQGDQVVARIVRVQPEPAGTSE